MKKAKTIVLSTTLSLSVLFTGCFGSFSLLHKVHDWNGSVSENKFVQELVFLGFIILPVYSLSSLIDAVILNTVEFWTGDNPLSMKEGEEQIRTLKVEGESYTIRTTKNKYEVTPEKGDAFVLQYQPLEASWYIHKNGQSHRLEATHFKNKRGMLKSQPMING
jgi:hypothetical protein